MCVFAAERDLCLYRCVYSSCEGFSQTHVRERKQLRMSQRQGSVCLNIDTRIPQFHYLMQNAISREQSGNRCQGTISTVAIADVQQIYIELLNLELPGRNSERKRDKMLQIDVVQIKLVSLSICHISYVCYHEDTLKSLGPAIRHKLQVNNLHQAPPPYSQTHSCINYGLLIYKSSFSLWHVIFFATRTHTVNQSFFVHHFIHPQQKNITALITELLQSLCTHIRTHVWKGKKVIHNYF